MLPLAKSALPLQGQFSLLPPAHIKQKGRWLWELKTWVGPQWWVPSGLTLPSVNWQWRVVALPSSFLHSRSPHKGQQSGWLLTQSSNKAGEARSACQSRGWSTFYRPLWSSPVGSLSALHFSDISHGLVDQGKLTWVIKTLQQCREAGWQRCLTFLALHSTREHMNSGTHAFLLGSEARRTNYSIKEICQKLYKQYNILIVFQCKNINR